MSQGEVLKLLKKSDKWMNVKEIVKTLHQGKNSITKNLEKLLK